LDTIQILSNRLISLLKSDIYLQHGLFTFHLLKKLKESKGEITTDGLFKYVKNKVGVESIMKFNKQQTPEILYGEEVNKDSLIFN
jgi:hypothetical protein